jgi:ATP-dependent DNA helicase RecG
MLDTQAYFELLKLPYPSTREGVIARLFKEHIVNDNHGEYEITNLGALVLAKNLLSFDNLQRKVVRIIVYKGINKIETVRDHFETKGYAVGYKDTISYIHSQLPADEVIGQALCKEVSTYPEIAIRELVANALVHALC